MIISAVHKKSPADRLGLRAGDELISIDDKPVRDPIDFQFYSAEEHYSLLLRRGEREWRVAVGPEEGGWFGIEFAEMEYRRCGNKCIFCFVDQNPPGLRDPLYFKDEDFRLSFMYGNYVTLTNVSRRDLQRIVDQRLSPLYVSVHSTEDEVRRRMLGLRRDDRLLEKIAFLAGAGIELHAQIVLVPDYNDGPHLEKSIADLAAFFPAVQSIAVVPLGLTGHRSGLTRLRTATRQEAEQLIAREREWEALYRRQHGSAFVYLADEFYLMAGVEVPAAARYDEFAQIENGVGMTRMLLDTFARQKRRFPKAIPPRRVVIATGTLIAPVLERHVLPVMRRVEGLDLRIVPVPNRFYGGAVTVSGLLAGQDFAAELGSHCEADLVLLPPNCRNEQGLFLDDWDLRRLEQETGVPVFAPEAQFGELFTYLKRS